MSCLRALCCLLLPPLSVIDRGCGALLIVTVLWIAGLHVGGVIAALFINYMSEQQQALKR